MTTLRSPFELWNRAVYSYESIPDHTSSSYHRSYRPKRGFWRTVVLPITAIGLLCMAMYAWLGSNDSVDYAHQEAVVPTLLSVVHAQNKTLVYALSNPLYTLLENAEILPMDSSTLNLLELPTLRLDKTQISPGDSLVLTWTEGRNRETGHILVQESDIIALYCDDDDDEGLSSLFWEAATMSQIRATTEFHGGSLMNSWYIPRFPHLRQYHCHFRLYSDLSPTSTVLSKNAGVPEGRFREVAVSESLEILHAKETPSSIHMALGEDPTKMIIQFTTGHVNGTTPVARVVTSTNSRSGNVVQLVEGTTDTYTANDMCQAPANITKAGHFYPPGMLHMIELTDLVPGLEYHYQVGLQEKNGRVLQWSKKYRFRSAPTVGDDQPFVYVVYGDQGCPYHGWQGGRKWMESMMTREGDNLSAVHHFGDISYARGAAHVWDAWLDMIQPMSTRVPLMVAVGNHEYDHTDGGVGKDPSGVPTANGYMPPWGNFGQDSGGECAVPTAKRFRMPSSATLSNGVFWYSFDYGSVHTIVISSEHDLSPTSPQYTFLESDLASVDRSKTPWLVLESHRPLYEGEGSGVWWRQHLVSQAMREEIEELLFAYNVDLVLAGHYHEYQRTCDGLYKMQCGDGGPIHITIGSAGAKLDAGFDLVNEWTEHFIKGEFGYGRVTIANSTDMHFEFVLHGTADGTRAGLVVDDVWIHRDR